MNKQINIVKPLESYWSRVQEGTIDQINRIKMAFGTKTKVKCHWDRTKHLFVVSGDVKLKLPKTDVVLNSGDSINIEVGEAHQLENIGSGKLELIEIERLVLPDEAMLELLEDQLHSKIS